MPYPPGVNFARVECFFKGKDRPWSNVFWFTTLTAFPGTWNLATFAAAANFNTAGIIINAMDAACESLGSNCLVHNAGLARSIDVYTTSSGGISGLGTLIPDDNCVVVSRLTTTPGKSGRGRIYFSGLNSGHIDENRLNSGGVTNWTAVAAGLKTAITDQGMTWSPANYSRKTSAFHAAVDFIVEPVIGRREERKPRR
jgi:hypothetical protein